MPQYAVVDFEATGLNTGTDRIVEIGVVLVDTDRQQIINSFETLVNPGRNVGATFIHGITERHVAQAPSFSDVAQQLSDFFHNSIVVAHNAKYDIAILASEYERLGLRIPVSIEQCVCTMTVGRARGLSGNLSEMTAQMNLPKNTKAHKALDDAVTTANLLVALGVSHPSARLWNTRSLYSQAPLSAAQLVTRENYLSLEAKRPKNPDLLEIDDDTIINLEAGDEVVFTGDHSSEWEDKLGKLSHTVMALGLGTHTSVRKSTTQVLITADPYSMSTKVQAAKKWDIPIISLADWTKALTSGRIKVSQRQSLLDVPLDKARSGLIDILTDDKLSKPVKSQLSKKFGMEISDDDFHSFIDTILG